MIFDLLKCAKIFSFAAKSKISLWSVSLKLAAKKNVPASNAEQELAEISGTCPRMDYEDPEIYRSDLYHMDNEGEDVGLWVFWWDGYMLYAQKGGTHGSQFGHDRIGKNYKGRYNPRMRVATIALPYNPGKVLSENEMIQIDEKSIPLINALYRRFRNLEKVYGV